MPASPRRGCRPHTHTALLSRPGAGGLVTLADLEAYEIEERYAGPLEGCPTLGTYRGPSPAASGWRIRCVWSFRHHL